MSYALTIYPAQVKAFIQSGTDWEDPRIKQTPLPAGLLAQILSRLKSYGYQAQTAAGRALHHFEKDFGGLPVSIHVYPHSIVFSAPYWEQLNEALFDIRMDALELTDSDTVALYDPQAGEWNGGVE